MRLVPKTLQARIVLLILLLQAVGQVAALRIFHHFELEPRASALALQVVSTVNLTRLALLAAQDDRRPELLRELNQSEGIRVYAFDPLEEIEPLPDDPLVQRMAEKVRESLGINTMIAVNHLDVRGLWVSFGIGLNDYWVVIPSVNTERPFPWEWLGWGALVMALSLFGAWFIMGRINRPLTALAHAADAIGRGERIGRLPESGASEFARVTHAINEMNQALARAEDDRNLLLGGVSHDLRTPLSRLRLAVEMLPETDDLKAGMTQDIEDMDAIIGQFLDFIRGGAGEAEVIGDLNALVAEVAERYRREGKWPILDLGRLPEFRFRRLAITRLLANLIDNAFHYGKEPVIIRTRADDQNVALSVIDHGPGLPEVDAERLMRPFERLDTARGREGAAGLGLSIAARIARLHGGNLVLCNLTQGGLEARTELPIKRA
ncbi:MAG: ATP-binding protein [Methylophilaceae bacterium]|nr:ATP-binding protein [Methylophilaceae bacterium]